MTWDDVVRSLSENGEVTFEDDALTFLVSDESGITRIYNQAHITSYRGMNFFQIGVSFDTAEEFKSFLIENKLISD